MKYLALFCIALAFGLLPTNNTNLGRQTIVWIIGIVLGAVVRNYFKL